MTEDLINHPSHYEKESVTLTISPIQLCEQLDFCLGNAFKYLFRYKNKGKPLQDLQKAEYYLKRFIDNYAEDIGLSVVHVLTADNFIFKIFREHQEWLQDWNDLESVCENVEIILLWAQKEIKRLKSEEDTKSYWREGQRHE